MKKNTIAIFLFGMTLATETYAQTEPYRNPNLSPKERAADLLKRLTLKEKISLMENSSPAVERLDIKPYSWWNEALHGVARNGLATVYPITMGMASSFDVETVEHIYSTISDEARAKFHEARRQGHYGRGYEGLTFWTPNVNIFRDPRWGRGQETWGEDPYLTSCMGVAVVKGLQGPEDAKYSMPVRNISPCIAGRKPCATVSTLKTSTRATFGKPTCPHSRPSCKRRT